MQKMFFTLHIAHTWTTMFKYMVGVVNIFVCLVYQMFV